MKKLHILFTTGSDSRYGEYHALLSLVRNLKDVNPDLTITIVLSYRLAARKKDFQCMGINVHLVPYEPFTQGCSDSMMVLPVKYILRGVQYLFGKAFALRLLEKQMDLHTVDIVHSNSSREDFGAAIAKKYNKPLVWHIREAGDRNYRLYSYRRNPVAYMNQNASCFIAISDHLRAYWIHKGIEPGKILRIYDGADEKSNAFGMECVRTEKTADTAFRIVMVGALYEGKGQWQMIRAVSLLPEEYKARIRLDFFGDGPRRYTRKLRRMVKDLGLEGQIHFLGYQEDLSARLSSYDCGVICSRCEGFGLVTVEYMMAGLPVLASDTGANPELIDDGNTGLLYHYSDIEDLKNKIGYLLGHRQETRKMGKMASLRSRNFTAKRNAEGVYQIYIKILEKGNEACGQSERNCSRL